jgi:cytoskeletal protein RodZ
MSIGQKLSAARHEQNKKRSTVAEDLNIREIYIEAIETDDYSVIPGKAYISGFIKSYAEYLDLDAEDLLKMLRATQNMQEDYQNMPQQLYKDYRRTKNIFLLSFVALLLVIVGFNYYSYVSHQINIRKIESKSSSSETLNSFFKQTQKIEEEVAAAVKKEKAVEDKEAAQKTEPKQEVSTKLDEAELDLYMQKSKPPFARILLKAKKDVWFQIRPINENRIYVSRTLPAGKAYWVTPWENVVLDVSNPAYMEIFLDDESLGFTGSNAKRVRGLFLNEKSLKEHFEKGENLNNDPIENYYKNPKDKQIEDLAV